MCAREILLHGCTYAVAVKQPKIASKPRSGAKNTTTAGNPPGGSTEQSGGSGADPIPTMKRLSSITYPTGRYYGCGWRIIWPFLDQNPVFFLDVPKKTRTRGDILFSTRNTAYQFLLFLLPMDQNIVIVTQSMFFLPHLLPYPTPSPYRSIFFGSFGIGGTNRGQRIAPYCYTQKRM